VIIRRIAFRTIVAAIGALSPLGLRAQVANPDSETAAAEDEIVARMQRFSDADLKRFYLHCSRAATRSLSSGDIAVCSVGYELLLRRTFGGDFDALLAWSRRHPDDGADIEPEDGELIESESPRTE
jgi:hypothetical protein